VGALGADDWKFVEALQRCDWSPEQVAGAGCRSRLPEQVAGELSISGILEISHETIYQHVLKGRRAGGTLWSHLRGSKKQRRKRYGAHDRRGILAGKRPIGDRPQQAENRETTGHWEIDTVHGGVLESVVTLVDRKSGFVQIGRLAQRTIEKTNRRLLKLMSLHPGCYQTITSDNGCEFHGYKEVEAKSDVKFYFATPTTPGSVASTRTPTA